MRGLWAGLAAVAIGAGAWADEATDGAVPIESQLPAPAGTYHVDPYHTRVIFGVNHLGFSRYLAQFLKVEADLTFDPAAPEAMAVTARIDPASIETNYPDPAFDFNALIAGADFLDAATYPEITFASTAVKSTGDKTADVTGDLTLHGVTKPVTLNVTFNGGYAGHPMDPGGGRVGFSATGEILRSDYGIGFGIPAPGTTLGVGDTVEIIIEAEFLNPDAAGPQTGP